MEKNVRVEKIKEQNNNRIFSSRAAVRGIRGELKRRELRALDLATAPPGYTEEDNYSFI